MPHQDTLYKHRNLIIGVNSPMHQSTFDDRVVTFTVNRCQHVSRPTRAKIDQVDATLFVEQCCYQGLTTLVEFTVLMSIVRSIVVRC